MYEILFTSQAERYFKKIKEKPLKEAYKNALTKLGENPYVGHPKVGDLTVKRLYQYNPNIEIKLNGKPVDAGQLFEEPRY
jgi:mRNA-degrading endonuclease RelE of RelBE toxin-antitoxin system